MDRKTIKTLLGVVRGTIPPDTIITNGKIVNVFTNSIDNGRSIIIKNGYIASVAILSIIMACYHMIDSKL
jgi:adenine deaminase